MLLLSFFLNKKIFKDYTLNKYIYNNTMSSILLCTTFPSKTGESP